MAKNKSLKTALIAGCTHDPFLDVKLWEAFCDFAKVLKPDVWHRNGDMFDFYQISSFSKDPERANCMVEDRAVFLEHENMIQRVLRKGIVKIATKGNHEDRVYKHIIHQPDIRAFMTNFGMELPTWYSFLQLEKFGYDARDSEGVRLPQVMYGDLAVWHGKKFSQYAVASNVKKMGHNACNHTHRARSWACKVGGANMYGYEMGHMASPELATHYIEDEEDWQQAWGVINFEDGGYFNVDVVLVKDVGMGKRRFSYKSDYWEWSV